jgi:DNA helicase IV
LHCLREDLNLSVPTVDRPLDELDHPLIAKVHLRAGQEIGTSRILLEEIERPRVGPMRDIVATIQPEQDELSRADLDQSICVQGAPGTGKPNPGN